MNFTIISQYMGCKTPHTTEELAVENTKTLLPGSTSAWIGSFSYLCFVESKGKGKGKERKGKGKAIYLGKLGVVGTYILQSQHT
jgi:hypothetical protein